MGRVFHENIEINENSMQDFWNRRSLKFDENNPYVSIKLGDKNPNRAQQWDEYEKNNIIPLLHIGKNDNVLEIGCGIGRLSDVIIPNSHYYLGTDYARDLINIARKRNHYNNCKYDFLNMSLQEISKENILNYLPDAEQKYHIIILDGVLPYINDTDIKESLKRILELAADRCTIYVGTAIGVQERLTLDNIYSEELESNYSAIYRTNNEYLELFHELDTNGFYLSLSNEVNITTTNNAETRRYMYIYRRDKECVK